MIPATYLDSEDSDPAEARRIDAAAEVTDRARARREERAVRCDRCAYDVAPVLRLVGTRWLCPDCVGAAA